MASCVVPNRGGSARNLDQYRECGVMVAYDIWDVVEQFESDTFYQLNMRVWWNGRHVSLRN